MRKSLWKKWIVLRVLSSVVYNFILATMGELEAAEIHVSQLFSVSKKFTWDGGHLRKQQSKFFTLGLYIAALSDLQE